MSISEKKRLSEKKELFLAICLISGEISSETIRRMKADFGDTQIKNNVIQSLRKDGYIKRVNRKNAGYGYQLTSSGLAYMKIKFPERYEYDLFSESKAYAYDENVRYRNTTLSAILYYLSRSGVELTNHAETMRKLFRGEHINVDAPFFITTKQMKMINRRFIPVYGYRIFGWIITQYAIYAVYFSDSQHPIHLSHEENVHVSLSITLQYAQSPYGSFQLSVIDIDQLDLVVTVRLAEAAFNRTVSQPDTRREIVVIFDCLISNFHIFHLPFAWFCFCNRNGVTLYAFLHFAINVRLLGNPPALAASSMDICRFSSASIACSNRIFRT